jgi:hypothetical protein
MMFMAMGASNRSFKYIYELWKQLSNEEVRKE